MVNYQSRFLGWDGRKRSVASWVVVLELLEFVGLTEQLETSWRLLAARLRWPPAFFLRSRPPSPPASHQSSHVDQAVLRKIHSLQFADRALHRKATQIFLRYIQPQRERPSFSQQP